MTGADGTAGRVPDDLRELAPAYALGALDEADRERFEHALRGSPELRAEVDAFRAAASGLGEAVPPVAPPARLKADLFARLDDVEQERAEPDASAEAGGTTQVPAREEPAPEAETPAPETAAPAAAHDELAARRGRGRTGRRGLALILASAAAVALIAAGAIVGLNWSGPNGWGAQREMAALAEASDAQQTTATVSGGGEVTLVSSADQGRSAIIAEGLPDVGDDQTYELWYIDDAGIVSAGTFDVRGDETWRLLEGEFAPGVAVGITVEPAGGSPQPTSDPVALLET
ncbi:hypothetical protein GE115_05690 [Agromyces sp. CFH 90414]|uniref:Regulator of SigK n=1 Tax=Agromyces agglutinans TaxID=2662258 RepID=A0A6I2F1L5_9MICO|nr:anti-sigma factor [Agromyces agglutinans]MRG59365.1 hypothetical protein [Agromyces agglutinans]